MTKSFESRLNQAPEEEKIPGYPPMQIERGNDGKLYKPDGTEILPNIPAGPGEHHLRLFVEYERTFGRGNAKYVTHTEVDNPVAEESYGQGFYDGYKTLAARYSEVARSGTPKDVNVVIQELANYRKRHPNLYKDAATFEEREKKLPRIRVVKDNTSK